MGEKNLGSWGKNLGSWGKISVRGEKNLGSWGKRLGSWEKKNIKIVIGSVSVCQPKRNDRVIGRQTEYKSTPNQTEVGPYKTHVSRPHEVYYKTFLRRESSCSITDHFLLPMLQNFDNFDPSELLTTRLNFDDH